MLIFETNKLPMIVPPVPWIHQSKGGYFFSKSNLLRLPESMEENNLLVERTEPSNMYPIYDSLNVLSSCPWKINKPILDLLIQLFRLDGDKELEVPEPSSRGPTIPKLSE